MKNSEGYRDPTAGQALDNIRKDDYKTELVLRIIKLVCAQAGYRVACTKRGQKIIALVIRR